ncbi:MAG: hypothetical protein ACO1SV_17780 [Fimbriimonas sp.]
MKTKPIVGALLLFGSCHTAFAGTYEVIGIVWYSNTATNGAFINGLSNFDVRYGATGYKYVNRMGTSTSTPTIQSQFKWKVRWTAAYPNEPAPNIVTATMAVYGHSYGHVVTQLWDYPTYYTSGTASWNDPFAPMSAYIFHQTPPTWKQQYGGTLTDAHHGYAYLGAEFTMVSPGVYESLVDNVVNSGGTVQASAQTASSGGDAMAELDVELKLRLISIAGQTLASDFP